MSQIRIIDDGDQNWDMEPEKDSAIETRMIGAEDILWDADGTDDIDSFTDRTGTERTITAINSGKIPLQEAVRAQLRGTTNVTEALLQLAERTGSTSSYSILEDDLTVVLSADLTHSQKQELIENQSRNLGGHTLTFQFPESLDLTISFNFIFSGFHNGKLVIDLNGIELSDAVALSSLILVRDCSCHVEIAGGSLKHIQTAFAIRAVRCPHLYLKNLGFTGSGLGVSHALSLEDSDGCAENCVYENDHEVRVTGFLADVPVAEHDASLTAHSGLFAGKANAEHTHTPSECGADAAGTAAAAVAAHDIAANPHSGVLAPLASPAFTGAPTAPTPDANSNDTTVATTAFAKTAAAAAADVPVAEHDASLTAHSGLFAGKANAEHTHTPSECGADAAGTAAAAVAAHDVAANPHPGVLLPLGEYQSHVSNVIAHRALVPAGVVFPFAGGGSVPTGFLLCNGQAVSRTAYADLFAAIGTLYGVGDGSTTFNVPNFCGRFLRGYESGVSAAIGTPQAEGLPDIILEYKKAGAGVGDGHFVSRFDTQDGVSNDGAVKMSSAWNGTSDVGHDIYGKSPHVTPMNYAVQWIIKY